MARNWITGRSRTLIVLSCAALLGSCARGREVPGETATSQVPAVASREVAGTPAHPLPAGDRPLATVLLFVAPDCPISNAYAPEIGRLVGDYAARGVAFVAVHADPRVSEDAAREHATAFNLRCPVLLDPKQELARSVGATVTPEAAVLDRGGTRVYLGRIDDLYYGYGRRRGAGPSTRELRDALDAVLAGRAVRESTVPAIGCEIPPPG